MTVTILGDPETHRLRQRLRDLAALQRRVADEIEQTQAALARHAADRRHYRPRNVKPACGTESAYHWHRYHEPDNWPLPKNDPCGCRAAHAEVVRIRKAEKRARREAA